MPKWTPDTVRLALGGKRWPFSEREIQNGVQFLLDEGTPIDCYQTGRVVVRGRASEIQIEAKALFGVDPLSPPTGLSTAEGPIQAGVNRVFIVYGHDVAAREQLELTLRRLKIEPIVLQNIPGAGDTIIEKLEVLTDSDFACVLLTPDDEGNKTGRADEKKSRARQNVVLELGMVLARLGRRRVAILVKGDNLERPSDIDGLIYILFTTHIDDAKVTLATNLQEAGFAIQVRDLMG